jgi:hypothetical protein
MRVLPESIAAARAEVFIGRGRRALSPGARCPQCSRLTASGAGENKLPATFEQSHRVFQHDELSVPKRNQAFHST